MRRTIGIQIGDEARGVGLLHYKSTGSRESAAVSNKMPAGWPASTVMRYGAMLAAKSCTSARLGRRF